MKCGIFLAAELEDVRRLGTLRLWLAPCCEMCWRFAGVSASVSL